jgi:hypothetical protein
MYFSQECLGSLSMHSSKICFCRAVDGVEALSLILKIHSFQECSPRRRHSPLQ